jgi:hypothetical protein
MPIDPDDLTEIERAGRRCQVCHTGRGWRRLQVARPPERQPVVLCGSCHTRFGDNPPLLSTADAVRPLAPAAAKPRSRPAVEERPPEPAPDRLLAAIRELPGMFSISTAAKVAGINRDKALVRLEELERRGEVQRVGNRWSAQAPPSELASALDRLAAQTSNLRIVKEPARVG